MEAFQKHKTNQKNEIREHIKRINAAFTSKSQQSLINSAVPWDCDVKFMRI